MCQPAQITGAEHLLADTRSLCDFQLRPPLALDESETMRSERLRDTQADGSRCAINSGAGEAQ